MGIFSRFGSRKDGSLVEDRGPEPPKEEEIQQDAAKDVAEVEQDDKYFSSDAPANQE
jgi:hypothetical protein